MNVFYKNNCLKAADAYFHLEKKLVRVMSFQMRTFNLFLSIKKILKGFLKLSWLFFWRSHFHRSLAAFFINSDLLCFNTRLIFLNSTLSTWKECEKTNVLLKFPLKMHLTKQPMFYIFITSSFAIPSEEPCHRPTGLAHHDITTSIKARDLSVTFFYRNSDGFVIIFCTGWLSITATLQNIYSSWLLIISYKFKKNFKTGFRYHLITSWSDALRRNYTNIH